MTALARFFGLMLIWLLPVVSGASAQTVAVPEGCTPIATVHKTACVVSTLFDCGSQRQILTYHDGTPDQTHMHTRDWGLAGFLYQANSDTRFDAVPGSGDVMTLSDLVADGRDTESGKLLFSTRVIQGREFVLQGEYVLSEDEVTLDGNVFRKGRLNRMFEREGVAGSRLEFAFDFYVSPELDLFFEGSFTSKPEGQDAITFERNPMSIRFAGEPGFLAARSEFGCE